MEYVVKETVVLTVHNRQYQEINREMILLFQAEEPFQPITV